MAQAVERELDFSVDRGLELPVGAQLVWRLRAEIAGERLRTGERLPSVRELAAAAEVNVNTVRAAYGRLEDEGYIVSRHGLGTFVADGAPSGAGLEAIAAEAAAEARAAGLDPRDLAAAIYAAAHRPAPGGDAADGDASPYSVTGPRSPARLPDLDRDPDQLAVRRSLRRQIARLESELAGYAEHLPPPEPTHPALRPKPHLAGVGELELIRDRLLERLSLVRDEQARRGARRQEARSQLEALVSEPERHKWQWVSNEDLGEPGCKYWYSRPRFGLLGAMIGWWRVKVSSGCPLAGA